MIWSIIPEEIIFANPAHADARLVMTSYLGRRVTCRPCGQGFAEITGLLSTDPADFLDRRFAPGNRIPLRG